MNIGEAEKKISLLPEADNPPQNTDSIMTWAEADGKCVNRDDATDDLFH